MKGTAERIERKTYMLPELVIIHILDFMKIIFVQLPHKTCKIRVLEHAWQDSLCEFTRVLQRNEMRLAELVMFSFPLRTGTHFDYETIAERTPANDGLE